MANQTISTDTNHDALPGRSAGEDINITNGARLTIDSMPHLTSMGILGDITISEGSLLIDGSRTFEVAYSGGSGSLPAIGASVSWNSGADSGKVVRLNSGSNVAGVLTITKNEGAESPQASDVLVSGGWQSLASSVKVGFLIVFGEDQDWGSVDGRSSLKITGDWYEIGTGTGADNQTLTLPHAGHQPAIWIETGSGTGVFEIWHRVNTTASAIYFSDLAQFGNSFESGFVFDQQFGSSTVTFGTAANGGVPPAGARIRIPNVHIGTTSTTSPTTEVSSATTGLHIGLIAPNTNLNVEIDHLNGSSCYVDFRGTNAVVVSDSCWGLWTTSAFINKVNSTVALTNCAVIQGAAGLAGGYLPAVTLAVLDNVGGITITDCVFMAGANLSNDSGLALTTMANLDFKGRCKFVSNQQDENTAYALRLTTASNITAETIIVVGGPMGVTTGSNNVVVDELVYGLPPGRGTVEETITNALVHTASLNCKINSGRFASGGAKHARGYIAVLTDSDGVTIRNFGDINAKIDGEQRCTGVVNFSGISVNCTIQRVWYENLNSAAQFAFVNSVADVTIENCSGDYNDEIELDANRVIVKGLHGASGTVDATTGVEGDLVNCLASVFLDYFKSDTTGAVGLIFNDRGKKHLADVEISAGTPIWNGLGDLLMRTTGDQVIYTWPYWIRGHTGFLNAAIQVSAVGTYDYDYDLDTGAGFSGTWKSLDGANLSSESISPSGFKIKVRITATSTSSSAAIKGLAILTNTTLSAQSANLYPLETVSLTLTGLKQPSEVRVFESGSINEIAGQENVTSGLFETSIDAGAFPIVDVSILSLGFQNTRLLGVDLSAGDVTIPVQQTLDRQYSNG